VVAYPGLDAHAQAVLQHFLSPSPSPTRASIFILYIFDLRTISREKMQRDSECGRRTRIGAFATTDIGIGDGDSDGSRRRETGVGADQLVHGASFPFSSSLGSMLKRSRAYALMPTLTGRTHLRTQAPRARKGHTMVSWRRKGLCLPRVLDALSMYSFT
jgi:hypothetical protein